MNSLIEILYTLSTALLVPVIVLLLGFVAWSLLEAGGFLREWRERRRDRAAWTAFQAAQQQGITECIPADSGDGKNRNSDAVSPPASFFERTGYPGLIGLFAIQGREFFSDETRLRQLVSEMEIEAAGRLARMNAGVRLSPILGLMGTLIPMGPALIGLSDGHIDQMARNLVVAFSTTVLGLFTGGICYVLLSVRRQWYARDLSRIEYVFACLHEHDGEQEHDGQQRHNPHHEHRKNHQQAEETATYAKQPAQLPPRALGASASARQPR